MQKLTPIITGKLLDNLNPHAVRIGLQRGVYTFGTAIFMTGRYVYDIRPEKVADYMGISIEELEKRVQEILSQINVQESA